MLLAPPAFIAASTPSMALPVTPWLLLLLHAGVASATMLKSIRAKVRLPAPELPLIAIRMLPLR
jgi:hypothetical protein